MLDCSYNSISTEIYRLMLNDKKYGLSVNWMATRAMPSLLPQTINPALNLEQFELLLKVLQDMLNHIERWRKKCYRFHFTNLYEIMNNRYFLFFFLRFLYFLFCLNFISFRCTLVSVPCCVRLLAFCPFEIRNQRNQLTLDNLSLSSPERYRSLRHQHSTDNMYVAPFNIPNLRIEQRKTSSAEDMARKNSTSKKIIYET